MNKELNQIGSIKISWFAFYLYILNPVIDAAIRIAPAQTHKTKYPLNPSKTPVAS